MIHSLKFQLKSLHVDSLGMGDEDCGLFENISLYAADIPGLAHIGLASTPALILGLDVLGQGKLILDLVDDILYVEDP